MLGLLENDPGTIVNYMGAPLHEYFKHKHGLDNGNVDLAIKYYREYYSVRGLYENKLYEGIYELLDKLKINNKIVYLVTVKPSVFAEEILKYFNLYKYFIKVYGSDLSTYNKSKKELIKNLLEAENISPGKAVMIGDRQYDVYGARHNNIKSIAVTYGYGSAEELAAANPDHTVSSVSELSDLLN